MYTQCPNCNVIFSMSEEDLDIYQGLVRCGRCSEVFNASWNLVDSVPHQELAGSEDITQKPEQKTAATPDVIDEFILDNVESDEVSNIQTESAEAVEQEQSLYSEKELDDSVGVEQDSDIAEPEITEAVADPVQAPDKSAQVEISEVGPVDNRMDDDTKSSVEPLDEDGLDRAPQDDGLTASDLVNESSPGTETEQVQQDTEIEYDDSAERNATDLNLPDREYVEADQDIEDTPEIEEVATPTDLDPREVVKTETDELEENPLDNEVVTEEIVMEESVPEKDQDTDEESLTAVEAEPIHLEAETETDDVVEESATGPGLQEIIERETDDDELEGKSLDTEAVSEEIVMEESALDQDLDTPEESPTVVEAEQILPEAETETGEVVEASVTDPGLQEIIQPETDDDDLEGKPLGPAFVTEEIVMEESVPDQDLDTPEESPTAVEAEQIPPEVETEPAEVEEASATDLGVPEVDILQKEPDGSEEGSLEAVDKEKIDWETEAESESDIDRTTVKDVAQEREPEVVASTEAIAVDELDASLRSHEQTAINKFESFDASDETSSVSDRSYAHTDEDSAIDSVDSTIDSEEDSTDEIDGDTLQAIGEELSDVSELEPVNDDVSEELVPVPEQETVTNVSDVSVEEDEQLSADQSSRSESSERQVDTDDVDSIGEVHKKQFPVPDEVAEEIVIEAPTRLWKMDEEIGEEAGDEQLPGWSAPEPRSVPASHEAADVKRVKIPQPRPFLTAAWVIGSLVLLFGLVWQIKGHYLTDLAQIPSMRAPLETMCQFMSCTVPPRKDIKSIDLVSTSVDPHPVTPGALRVSANLINRAAFAQEFPPLEITLTDKEGKVVGRRTYLPHEYRVERPNKMLPNVLERADFDLAQPDEAAVGYEIQLVAR